MVSKLQPATKSDLKNLETSLKKEIKEIKDNTHGLQGQINELRDDIIRLETRIDTQITEGYSKLFNLIDPLLGEIRDNRDYRTITTNHLSQHDCQINALNSVVFARGQ